MSTDIDTGDDQPSVEGEPVDVWAAVPDPTGGAWWRLGGVAAFLVAVGALTSWGVLAVLVGVLSILVVHEAGHLIAARRTGILATEYSIGMGPVIYSTRRRGMAWSLRAIPVGAFVRVIGMTADQQYPPDVEELTYRQASFRKRLAVAGGGPAANFAFAAVLLTLSLMLWGSVDPTNWRTNVVGDGSPAAAAGIDIGDRVTSIDGEPTGSFEELSEQVASRPGDSVEMTVIDGDGRARDTTVQIGSRVMVWGTVGEDLELVDRDGTVAVGAVLPDGVVDTAGVEAGLPVIEINSTPVRSLADAAAAISAADSGTVVLTSPDGENYSVDLGEEVATPGVTGVVGMASETVIEPLGVGPAAVEAGRQLGSTTVAAVAGLGKALWPPNLIDFVTSAATTAPGEVSAAPAAGAAPDENRFVSMYGVIGFGADLAGVSIGALLWFLALMNLFIGMFNLVPVPPLDGGHIVVACYERIREVIAGTRDRYLTSTRALNAIAAVAVTVILTVGAAALWLDIADPVL